MCLKITGWNGHSKIEEKRLDMELSHHVTSGKSLPVSRPQFFHLKMMPLGTFLVFQLLRLHLLVQRRWVLSLLRELTSHMPHGQKKTEQNRSNIEQIQKKILKVVHIKIHK